MDIKIKDKLPTRANMVMLTMGTLAIVVAAVSVSVYFSERLTAQSQSQSQSVLRSKFEEVAVSSVVEPQNSIAHENSSHVSPGAVVGPLPSESSDGRGSTVPVNSLPSPPTQSIPENKLPVTTASSAQTKKHSQAKPGLGSGEPIAKMRIPSIGLDQVVTIGVSSKALSMGPGWWPGTSSPGHMGNSVIAGHRTSFGAPFKEIDKIAAGDEIHFDLLDGRKLTYIVTQAPTIVDQSNSVVPIMRTTADKAELTLFSCHPLFQTSQRIYIRAELLDQATALPSDATGKFDGQAEF